MSAPLHFQQTAGAREPGLRVPVDTYKSTDSLLTLSQSNSRRQHFRLQIFKKCETQAVSYLEFKDKRANSVDLDEMAHYEPPHQDLRCLQIQLFLSLVLKELSSESLGLPPLWASSLFCPRKFILRYQ